jgi:acylglycerol lipase
MTEAVVISTQQTSNSISTISPTIEPILSEALHQPPPTTCYDNVDPTLYLGPSGYQKTITNHQQLKLKAYYWPAKNPKASIIFVHGHGSHLFFELLKTTELGQPPFYTNSWAERWNDAGISVTGIDLQGCGRSEGLRFYVNSFDDYISDNMLLARSLADEPGFANVPLFISGISMGGNIALNCILKDIEETNNNNNNNNETNNSTNGIKPPPPPPPSSSLFSGVALLAPMICLDKVSRKGLNPYLRPISTILSWLTPTAAVVATDKNTMYPDIQDQWDADPLVCHMNTRVRNANEYLRSTELLKKKLHTMTAPFIVFHSENDTMCDCDGSKDLYLKAQSEDKALRLVNKHWHILVKEEGNVAINEEIGKWVLARAQRK